MTRLFQIVLRVLLLKILLLANINCVAAEQVSVEIVSPRLEPPYARARETTRIVVDMKRSGGTESNLQAELVLPPTIVNSSPMVSFTIPDKVQPVRLGWEIMSPIPLSGEARLILRQGESVLSTRNFPVCWHPAVTVSKAAYVPPPEPVNTGRYLIGAMMCSLWKQGTLGANWNAIFPYPEREPLLGWYDEGNPEVTDWEIKWLLDHGVSFGVLCWFRDKGNAGKPVKPILDHWIKSLSECHYGKQFKYAVMWENGNAIASGVQSEDDLIHNLLPFWIKNYFCQTNYLMIDGKPLLYIYRPEILTSQLGGEAKTRAALVKLRAACVRAGFKGLTILGENHSAPAKPVTQMVDIGLDASFSYHWPSFSGHFPADPTSQNLINAQADCWRDQAAAAPLPAVTTVSMGWDSCPWGRPFSEVSWHLPPAQFQQALVRAKAFMDQSPTNSLPGRMLLLDNWNEFGEGHYIFPTREFGFGYLDAVRDAFAPNAPPHRDLTPEDLGLGHYETALHTVTR